MSKNQLHENQKNYLLNFLACRRAGGKRYIGICASLFERLEIWVSAAGSDLVTVLVVASVGLLRIGTVLNLVAVRYRLWPETKGALREIFQGLASEPETATAVKVFEVLGDGGEGVKGRVCQGLAPRYGQTLKFTFGADTTTEMLHKAVSNKGTTG